MSVAIYLVECLSVCVCLIFPWFIEVMRVWQRYYRSNVESCTSQSTGCQYILFEVMLILIWLKSCLSYFSPCRVTIFPFVIIRYLWESLWKRADILVLLKLLLSHFSILGRSFLKQLSYWCLPDGDFIFLISFYISLFAFCIYLFLNFCFQKNKIYFKILFSLLHLFLNFCFQLDPPSFFFNFREWERVHK